MTAYKGMCSTRYQTAVSFSPNTRYVTAVAYDRTVYSIGIMRFHVLRFRLFRDHGLLLCDPFTLIITIAIIRGELKFGV